MPGNPLSDPNWAPNLADTVERIVVSIRDKTTKPALIATRALIFGVIAAVGGGMLFVLLMISFTRAFEVLFDTFLSHGDVVWFTYLVFGALLALVGMWALRARLKPGKKEKA